MSETGNSDDRTNPGLVALADYLSRRREGILNAWLDESKSDPKLTTIAALTREQFNDHIPEVLDAYEQRLRAGLDRQAESEADKANLRESEAKHGLHRWQQGYRLGELTREWNHFLIFLSSSWKITPPCTPIRKARRSARRGMNSSP